MSILAMGGTVSTPVSSYIAWEDCIATLARTHCKLLPHTQVHWLRHACRYAFMPLIWDRYLICFTIMLCVSIHMKCICDKGEHQQLTTCYTNWRPDIWISNTEYTRRGTALFGSISNGWRTRAVIGSIAIMSIPWYSWSDKKCSVISCQICSQLHSWPTECMRHACIARHSSLP